MFGLNDDHYAYRGFFLHLQIQGNQTALLRYSRCIFTPELAQISERYTNHAYVREKPIIAKGSSSGQSPGFAKKRYYVYNFLVDR